MDAKMEKEICGIITMYAPFSFDEIYSLYRACESFDTVLKAIDAAAITGTSLPRVQKVFEVTGIIKNKNV